MDLKSTLNLPDPNFTIPMKGNLPALEPQILAKWEAMDLYHRIQSSRATSPTFLLHDGPPYTNSPIHIGTALNKVLKDFVVKSRTMLGFRAPFVPGYDNHGLPIEQAVMRAFHEKKESPDVVTLRKACRAHAQKFIDIQSDQFKRLGVFGLWEKPYTTMNFKFEAEIVRVFKRLVERGYVYRGLRPTQWSPTSRTALADTEIIYKDHVSKAIYVRFPLKKDPNGILSGLESVFTIIWTTTPWTIPANLAVAFHPELEYGVVKVGGDHYVILESLVPKVAEALGWPDYTVVRTLEGINFDHAVFAHPIFGRDSLGVVANYVTTEDGTGVVHTAPGHGRDDFYTGMKYGLPILCPVDERGMLNHEAGEFEGISYKECDTVVVNRLLEVGHLLKVSDYYHSYPYAERDERPVIFRATEQWFVAMDHMNLRQHMLEETAKVEWLPASGINRIQSMVAARPDWCISRQRPWGVGIPVFFGKESNKPVLDPDAIECVAKLVEVEGSDAWFEKDAKDILPQGYTHPETGESEFRKETDVLDVWFDSGSTHIAVFEGNVEPEWKEEGQADLYLEGSDQHRGWFNSSLVIGVATKGRAPYRQVVTHGFVEDEKGLKMSKRSGNSVEPVKASDEYGADVLRYWVASVDWANDAPCSDGLLKQMGEGYRTVRNTLRFLLGNLDDYDGSNPELLDLDEWMIEQVDLLVSDCSDAYKRYDFGAVINGVHNFCAKELSRFYLDAIKDRMYCDGKDWPSRRSGQYACHYALVQLVRLLAPILAFTAEETYSRIPCYEKLESVHMDVFGVPSNERLQEIEASPLQTRFAALLSYRASMFAQFEVWKAEAGLKDSQDAYATVWETGETLDMLRSFGGDLALYCKMSQIELREGPSQVEFKVSEFLKCERCRLRREDVEIVDGIPLSARDRRVLGL